MKKFSLLVLSLFLLSFFACNNQKSKQSEGKETIKIGVIAPLTGDVATYGEWFKNSVEIAKEEINSNGGILGKNIEIIYEDTKGEQKEGVNAINKLINIDKVKVIIGAVKSGVTLAIAPIAENNKIVLLTPISSSYKITNAGDYIFRIAPSDALQGVIVANWAFNDLKFAKAAVLLINNDYGIGLENEFKTNFEKLGGRIIISEKCPAQTTDFKTQLINIKNLKPDFIFCPVYPQEAGIIVKQIKEIGINIPVIGTDPFHDSQVLTIAGNAANGISFTDVANNDDSIFKEFAKKYRINYNKEANIVAAECYDAINIICLAIQMANSTESEKIKNALYKIQNYNGASGIISFDRNGDVSSKTFFKYKIVDGNYIKLD